MIGIKRKTLLIGLATIAFLSITTVVGIANTFISHYKLEVERTEQLELKDRIEALKEENRDLTIVNACQRDDIETLEAEIAK